MTDEKIVKAGRNLVRDLVSGDSSSNLTHMAFGTGTTDPLDTDTTMETETNRKAFDTYTNSDSETIYEGTLLSTEGNGNTISEIGLLTASSGGTLFSRATITGIAKDNTKELLVEYKVDYSDES